MSDVLRVLLFFGGCVLFVIWLVYTANNLPMDKNEKELKKEPEGNLIDHAIGIPKIKNGARIIIGNHHSFTVVVDHHFNWFQKKMIRWCFGFEVEDYDEED